MTDRAHSYDELKDAISESYPRMSPQLQRIARFALEKPHDLALGTVAAVAKASDVQPSSMIRFARASSLETRRFTLRLCFPKILPNRRRRDLKATWRPR